MNLKPIKSFLLKIALGVHNTATFIALNVLLWRNNLWKKEEWTKLGETSETGEKSKAPVEQVEPATL
ncbi:MAG: hypothetical protein ABH871_09595 [Pseudomonadota bacterium]